MVASTLPNVQHSAILTKDDLEKLGCDHPAYDAASNILSSFEEAWAKFLDDEPLFIEGETAARIQKMHEEAESIRMSKRSVEEEFEKHFETVSRGRKELERQYRKKIEKEKAHQASLLAVSESMSKRLQSASESFERSQEWRRFTRGLGCLAEDYDASDKLGPSIHALVLADLTDPASKDRLARASRVDLALAKAHADVLEKEIEGYQTLLPLLQRTEEDLRG